MPNQRRVTHNVTAGEEKQSKQSSTATGGSVKRNRPLGPQRNQRGKTSSGDTPTLQGPTRNNHSGAARETRAHRCGGASTPGTRNHNGHTREAGNFWRRSDTHAHTGNTRRPHTDTHKARARASRNAGGCYAVAALTRSDPGGSPTHDRPWWRPCTWLHRNGNSTQSITASPHEPAKGRHTVTARTDGLLRVLRLHEADEPVALGPAVGHQLDIGTCDGAHLAELVLERLPRDRPRQLRKGWQREQQRMWARTAQRRDQAKLTLPTNTRVLPPKSSRSCNPNTGHTDTQHWGHATAAEKVGTARTSRT